MIKPFPVSKPSPKLEFWAEMDEGIFWTDEGPLQGYSVGKLPNLDFDYALEIRHRKVPQNIPL